MKHDITIILIEISTTVETQLLTQSLANAVRADVSLEAVKRIVRVD
jgi:hypothetical protein